MLVQKLSQGANQTSSCLDRRLKLDKVSNSYISTQWLILLLVSSILLADDWISFWLRHRKNIHNEILVKQHVNMHFYWAYKLTFSNADMLNETFCSPNETLYWQSIRNCTNKTTNRLTRIIKLCPKNVKMPELLNMPAGINGHMSSNMTQHDFIVNNITK